MCTSTSPEWFTKKARVDFDEWLKQHHLPVSTHAGIPDTSELMYLGGDAYVRKDRLAAGDGKNGVVGDARPSTPELGKRVFDMKVEYGGRRYSAADRSPHKTLIRSVRMLKIGHTSPKRKQSFQWGV